MLFYHYAFYNWIVVGLFYNWTLIDYFNLMNELVSFHVRFSQYKQFTVQIKIKIKTKDYVEVT